MALTDEQEKRLKDELEQTKATLKLLQDEAAKQKQGEPEIEKDKDGKPPKEKPTKPKVDPDIAKSITEALSRIEAIEKRIGTGESKKPNGKLLNFFGDD